MSSAVCVIFDCNIHIDVAERMLGSARVFAHFGLRPSPWR